MLARLWNWLVRLRNCENEYKLEKILSHKFWFLNNCTQSTQNDRIFGSLQRNTDGNWSRLCVLASNNFFRRNSESKKWLINFHLWRKTLISFGEILQWNGEVVEQINYHLIAQAKMRCNLAEVSVSWAISFCFISKFRPSEVEKQFDEALEQVCDCVEKVAEVVIGDVREQVSEVDWFGGISNRFWRKSFPWEQLRQRFLAEFQPILQRQLRDFCVIKSRYEIHNVRDFCCLKVL